MSREERAGEDWQSQRRPLLDPPTVAGVAGLCAACSVMDAMCQQLLLLALPPTPSEA